ncbi:hypothetical protein [Rubripirellula tenax]|nr:hypothetical protein [Rubripirellula tenax]
MSTLLLTSMASLSRCFKSFAVLTVLVLPACDNRQSRPTSMRSSGEQYDAQLAKYADRHGPPLVKVVSADNGDPVPDVFVGMTLIGPDGGDGGFEQFLTRADGIAERWSRLSPGRYQYHARPRPDGRFVRTEWRRGDPYFTVDESGGIVDSSGTAIVPTITLQTGGSPGTPATGPASDG